MQPYITCPWYQWNTSCAQLNLASYYFTSVTGTPWCPTKQYVKCNYGQYCLLIARLIEQISVHHIIFVMEHFIHSGLDNRSAFVQSVSGFLDILSYLIYIIINRTVIEITWTLHIMDIFSNLVWMCVNGMNGVNVIVVKFYFVIS